MKEFYKIANKDLMIRASNPVVRSIKTGIEGEEEVAEDRVLVEEAIANYFKDIYKKPDYMGLGPCKSPYWFLYYPP